MCIASAILEPLCIHPYTFSATVRLRLLTTSMSLKSLELWGHWGAPNPFKVAVILEALGFRYETHPLELSEVKQEEYIKLNPNGRLPTLHDPNTGLTLWEVSLR